MNELGWVVPGHRAAVEAGLLRLLVNALRVQRAMQPLRCFPGHQVALVARLRLRIETHFRAREPMATYAAELGTSKTRLRAACATVAGQSADRNARSACDTRSAACAAVFEPVGGRKSRTGWDLPIRGIFRGFFPSGRGFRRGIIVKVNALNSDNRDFAHISDG